MSHDRPHSTALVASNHDLAAVAGYAALAALAVALPGDLPTPVAVPLALPLLVFAPGYAVVTALVPATNRAGDGGTSGDRLGVRQDHGGLSRLERLTLAVVASVAVVPLVALACNFVVGVALVPVVAAIAAVTASAALVGALRRRATPRSATGTGDAGPSSHDRSLLAGVPTDGITLGCAAIAALLLVSSAALAVTGGQAAGTEFYLVEETAEGDYAATGYPETVERGAAVNVSLGVKQHGDEPRRYATVAVLEERSGPGANASVTDRRELDRASRTVAPGEASVEPVRLTPPVAGEDLVLTFLLYRGSAPADPTRESAHRVLTLPVTVTDG